jgi:hypothetical protein
MHALTTIPELCSYLPSWLGAVPNGRGQAKNRCLNPLRVKNPQARSRPVCTLGPLQAGAFRVTHEENKIPMYRFIPYNLELHPSWWGAAPSCIIALQNQQRGVAHHTPRRLREGLQLCALLFALLACGCRDLSDYSTKGARYEGTIAGGSFVRAGFESGVRMCLTLDTEKLQEAPGVLQTSDRRVERDTAMRPIPQSFHDPISTLRFGDERESNFMYVAAMKDGADAFIVLSLLKGGSVEARVVRGAPGGNTGAAEPLFAIFPMKKETGPCSF